MLLSDDLRLRARAAFQGWRIDQPQTMAIDTETTGVTFDDEAFCVTVAWRKGFDVVSHYIELLPENLDETLRMLNGTPAWAFHNAKFDLQKLSQVWGDRLQMGRELHDTEALAHLLDEHQRKGLKPLARSILGEETDEEDAIRAYFRKEKIKKADWSYDQLPRDLLIRYAVKDAEFTFRLWERLLPQVQKFDDLHGLYRSELDLTLVLLDMESRGMALDVPYLERTTKEYATKILQDELAIRQLTQTDEFNPRSPKQILEAMEARGIDLDSTDKAALAELDDPLAETIVQLRYDSKMHGTYLLPLLHEQRNGVVHPWFGQHNARTGRMSSRQREG